MSANRFRPTPAVPARAITSGRFRNAPPEPVPTQKNPPHRPRQEETVRYRRVRRYGRLFIVVNPPARDDLEETLGAWLDCP